MHYNWNRPLQAAPGRSRPSQLLPEDARRLLMRLLYEAAVTLRARTSIHALAVSRRIARERAGGRWLTVERQEQWRAILQALEDDPRSARRLAAGVLAGVARERRRMRRRRS